jgi:cytochrome b561
MQRHRGESGAVRREHSATLLGQQQQWATRVLSSYHSAMACHHYIGVYLHLAVLPRNSCRLSGPADSVTTQTCLAASYHRCCIDAT